MGHSCVSTRYITVYATSSHQYKTVDLPIHRNSHLQRNCSNWFPIAIKYIIDNSKLHIIPFLQQSRGKS
ncbi:hypothetical protein ACP275_12G069300 [Erythranthe tilingii]